MFCYLSEGAPIVGGSALVDTAGRAIIKAVGNGKVGATRPCLEQIGVAVDVILALETMLTSVVVFRVKVWIAVVAVVAIVIAAEDSAFDLETLPRADIAAIRTIFIRVARD